MKMLRDMFLGAILYITLSVLVGLYLDWKTTGHIGEPSSVYGTTIANDGVPFERYCGYLMKIGRGSISFDDEPGEPLRIAYLFFRDNEGKPSIVKVIYGNHLVGIRPNQFYDLGMRKYAEGLNFPRRLEVVKECQQ